MKSSHGKESIIQQGLSGENNRIFFHSEEKRLILVVKLKTRLKTIEQVD